MTLKTWFLVGLVPILEIDRAAIWNITPSVTHVVLTDARPKVDVILKTTNNGILDFDFLLSNSPVTNGIFLNTSGFKTTLKANSSHDVMFNISFDPEKTSSKSFTTSFLVPFYSSLAGYGPCFRPQIAEIVVVVLRQQQYYPSPWAQITIWLLTGITLPMIVGSLVVMYLYRFSPPVLALAPRLCVWTFAGLMFLLIASVMSIASPTVEVCEISRWFFHLGFTLAAASIIARNFRNRHIFTSKKLQIVAIVDWKLMMFICLCLLVDVVLLLAGLMTEPYYLALDGHCALRGWVAYSLLVATKVILWLATIYNTMRMTNIPSSFSDTRLNVVLVICAIFAIVQLGLQYADAFVDDIGIELFLGALFIWCSDFLVCSHIVLKLRGGYIAIARKQNLVQTRSRTLSRSMSSQRLRDRLEDLLLEIEAQNARFMVDKTTSTESVKTNQKLMYEVRAELLAMNSQGQVTDEDLQTGLPPSIKAALEKFGPALSRRRDLACPPPTSRNRLQLKIEGKELETKQLICAVPLTPSSLPFGNTSDFILGHEMLPKSRANSDHNLRLSTVEDISPVCFASALSLREEDAEASVLPLIASETPSPVQ